LEATTHRSFVQVIEINRLKAVKQTIEIFRNSAIVCGRDAATAIQTKKNFTIKY
jgi:hypothetical protein